LYTSLAFGFIALSLPVHWFLEKYRFLSDSQIADIDNDDNNNTIVFEGEEDNNGSNNVSHMNHNSSPTYNPLGMQDDKL
jgi:hypothetical protein